MVYFLFRHRGHNFYRRYDNSNCIVVGNFKNRNFRRLGNLRGDTHYTLDANYGRLEQPYSASKFAAFEYFRKLLLICALKNVTGDLCRSCCPES